MRVLFGMFVNFLVLIGIISPSFADNQNRLGELEEIAESKENPTGAVCITRTTITLGDDDGGR